MKLYTFPVAPNPTKLRLYLAEKAAAGCRIPLEEVTVNLIEKAQHSAEHRARNPFGTLPVLETDSPVGYPANPAVAEYYRGRLPRNLAYLENLLADGRPFLAGQQVTVGDCTLAAALQFGRFRKLAFLDGHPRLEAWDARFRSRATARSVLVA